MFAHRHLPVANLHFVDAKIGPIMSEPRPRNELVRGGQVSQHNAVSDPDPAGAHDLESFARPGSNRDHDVGMGLVSLIQHSPTSPAGED